MRQHSPVFFAVKRAEECFHGGVYVLAFGHGFINPSEKYFTYELCSNPGTVIPAKAGIQPFLSDVELYTM